jgi:hypothetical protein
MGLAVLPPDPEEDVIVVQGNPLDDVHSPSDSDVSMYDDDGRPLKRARLSPSSSRKMVLPGEVITEETKWMR